MACTESAHEITTVKDQREWVCVWVGVHGVLEGGGSTECRGGEEDADGVDDEHG